MLREFLYAPFPGTVVARECCLAVRNTGLIDGSCATTIHSNRKSLDSIAVASVSSIEKE